MYSTASEPGLRRSFQLFMCLYWNYKALGNFYQIYISRFISMESPAMCLMIMIHILCLRTDISWKLPYVGLKYIFHGNSEEACYTEDAENSKGLQNKLSYSLRQKWLGHFNQTLFFFLLVLPSSLSKLFRAVRSPNLVRQHWGYKETPKCPNHCDWDCRSPSLYDLTNT